MKKETARSSIFRVKGGCLGPKDYLSYGLAGLGQNMVFGIMNSYLMIFYTDVFLVPASAVGTMFLISKLWDGLNDPIMGTFVDRTRTKWGKVRPYLLFTPLPILILTVLIFCAPQLNFTGKMIYMYVTYIAWGMVYTVCDVPYWSMSAVLTPHVQERTNLVSITRFLTGVGMGAPTVVVSALMFCKSKNILAPVAGSNEKVYFWSAVLMAGMGCALLSLGFFGTKERVPQNDQKPKFSESIKLLVSNKPLMLILLCNLLAFPRAISGIAQTYVATYLLGGGQWVVILGIPVALGGVVAIVLCPWMVSKFGTIKTYIIANIVSLFPMGILYFFGYQNIPLILFFLALSSIAGGVIGVVPTILIGDCVDYMEWKTGQRAEGVSFSVQTFMAKATSALQGWAAGLLLTAFHYVQPMVVNGKTVEQVQSMSTKNGIWAMFTILPVAASVLSIIPLFFYDLKGKKLEQIQADLRERHSQVQTAAE